MFLARGVTRAVLTATVLYLPIDKLYFTRVLPSLTNDVQYSFMNNTNRSQMQYLGP